MATATADKAAGPAKADGLADVYALLGDGDHPLADVLAAVPEADLARAWLRGDVEFGRPSFCVSGRPEVPRSNPTLYVEGGADWPKRGARPAPGRRFKDVLADLRRVPECGQYRKYVKGRDPQTGDDRFDTVVIERAEAVRLLAPLVRLTEKGAEAAAG